MASEFGGYESFPTTNFQLRVFDLDNPYIWNSIFF
jgi:hypothetical protein